LPDSALTGGVNLTDDEWRALIEQARASSRAAAVRAETFLKKWATASAPVLVRANSGDYVVKGAQTGKQAVNDQIIGRLGMELDSPVGKVCLIDVPAELIAAEREMGHITPGLAHASAFIPACTERASLEHATVKENKARFASLAVLHGWVVAHDQQFIYENAPPHLVYSVDHGHFFPGGPDWTIAGLGAIGAPQPDATITTGCGLQHKDFGEAAERLRAVTDAQLASVIAAPPDAWAVLLAERIALAQYLARRRDQLVTTLLP
jgi:hypothetical protein